MNTPITITDDAKAQFKSLMDNHDIEAFEFGVNGGGCSGFSYTLKGVELCESIGNYESLDFDGVHIIIPVTSMFAIMGTEINYKTDIMGSSVQFNNPTATSSCGCGTSFGV